MASFPRTALVFSLFAAGLLAWPVEVSGEIRSWMKDDGLLETYAATVRASPTGDIWVSHDLSLGFSKLDGFSVESIPRPQTKEYDFAVTANGAWALDVNGVWFWDGGGWSLHLNPDIEALPPLERAELQIVAISDDRALIPLGGELLLCLPTTRACSPVASASDLGLESIRTVSRSFSDDFLVGGAGGIVRMGLPSGSNRPEIHEAWPLPPYLRDVTFLNDAGSGEILIVAETWTSRQILYQVVEGRWEELSRADGSVMSAWRGARRGLIWVRNDEQFFSLSATAPEQGSAADIIPGITNATIQASDGSVWVATTLGLHRVAEESWRPPDGFQFDQAVVHSAYQLTNDTMWFAAGGYLLRNQVGNWTRYALPEGHRTYELHVQGLAPIPDGRLVLKATDSKFLLLFAPQTKSFSLIEHPEKRRIRLVAPRSDGSVWVNTSHREDRFDQRIEVFDGKTFQTYLDLRDSWQIGRMRYLTTAQDGSLWIGGTEGLGRYHNGSYSVVHPGGPFEKDGAYVIAEDSQGRVYVSGRAALQMFDGKSWTVVSDRLGKIRSINFESDGTMWCAGEEGVFHNRSGNWVRMGVSDGLPGDVAYVLHRDPTGRLWAGTSNGVAQFDPQVDRTAPRVRIVSDENKIELPSHGFARLEFDGHDYWHQTEPARLLYSYQLDKQPWSDYSSDPRATLSGLSGGDHRLNVRALDRVGHVGESASALQLVVALPWYRQPMFLVLSSSVGVLILCLLLIAAGNYRRRGEMVLELQKSRREAEQALETKGRFLANMSHEIRTPMNGIIGLTEVLLESEMPAEQRRTLEVVSDSSQTLLSILNDVLDFSRIEADKVSIEVKSFELRALLGKTIHLVATRAHQKSLDLTWRALPDVPNRIQGDPDKLRQIIFNLVGNAIKFTKEGQVHVEVRKLEESANGVGLEFCIVDTGIGIPIDRQASVFEAFVQADSSTSRKFGGSGLGLAISSRLAKAMGGKLTIESPQTCISRQDCGPGSMFRVQLPFTITADSSGPPAPSWPPGLELIIATTNEQERMSLVDIAAFLQVPADAPSDPAETVEDWVASSNRDGKILVVSEDLADTFRDTRKPGLAPCIVLIESTFVAVSDGEQHLQRPPDPAELYECLKAFEPKPEVPIVVATTTEPVASESSQRPTMRVLLVEDNPVNQLVAKKILRKQGYTVHTVENGVEALEALEQSSFEVVLMDMQMPVMDGR